MPETFDIIVIGGGVAGLMAAGAAASQKKRVLLLEKMEKPARKLRITGKGRCNVTNLRDKESFLEKVRSGGAFVRPAFELFDNKKLAGFIEHLGVPVVIERGDRVFPQSGNAWDVANAIERWTYGQNAEVRCNAPVKSLIVNDRKISGVETESGKIYADCVIIATGGVSYPSTGSTGDGHEMAHYAGHRIEPLRPALVPLVTPLPERFDNLHLLNVDVSLIVDGDAIEKHFGEMEFTQNSVAGPVILQASRSAVDAIVDGRKVEIAVDLKPALSNEKLAARIDRELAILTNATYKILLQKLVPRQLHCEIASRSGISLKKPLAQFTPDNKNSLVKILKDFRLPITDYRPFTEAIVTAGGMDLSEVDPLTMESRIVGGLYFAGEILDIDADTGGFNIQLACSTGYLAGISAAGRNHTG